MATAIIKLLGSYYCRFFIYAYIHAYICLFFYCIVPPAYGQQPGYPPQQPGYYPPPQPGYPPQGYPPQGYTPAAPVQQQSSTNVVVVGGAPAQQTTIIQRPRERVNHVLHLLITIFIFPPWIIIWIILCMIYGV